MSLQSRNIHATRTLPLASILRPIPPVLDDSKIDNMVCTLQKNPPAGTEFEPGTLPPVDILHYQSPAGKDFYFAFGGCHRLQAYGRAQVEDVNCKVLKVTKSMLKVYLGGSVDAIVGE